jgi:dTDP-4-amino-4,6-dideoxygalactose transaminase
MGRNSFRAGAMRRAVLEALRDWPQTPAGGAPIRKIEELLSEYVGGRALAVGSGTVALEVALRAAGVGPGDEVVLPAYDWGAAAGAVLRCGAQPVFADVDAVRATLDPASLKARITRRTVAVVVTHWAGCPADLDAILAVARSRGLFVIEDCAQALGARYQGRPVGSFGDAAVFSFGWGKLVCAGEGGAVVFRDAQLWRRAVGLCQHPLRQLREQVEGLGDLAMNARMHPLPAALVAAQWELWPAWLERRRRACIYLTERLKHRTGLVAPSDPPQGIHSFHRYVLRLPEESLALKLRGRLAEEGFAVVNGQVHQPLHLRVQVNAAPGECPQAEHWSRCSLAVDQDWTRVSQSWLKRFADAVLGEINAMGDCHGSSAD